MGTIYKLALIIGFTFAALQLIVIARKSLVSGQGMGGDIADLLFRIVLGALIISPPVYFIMMKFLFALPADSIASAINSITDQNFVDSIVKLLDSFKDTSGGGLNIMKSILGGTMVANLLAGLIWILAFCCIFITSYLQSILFLYLFILGPICIVFGFFDWTVSVFKAWVSLTLTVCWVGVVGSASFLVCFKSGLLKNLEPGLDGWAGAISIIIFGTVAIILFCSAFPITAYFFKSLSSTGAITSPTTAAGGIVGGVTTAGAAVGAAQMSYGAGMKAVGSAMESFGSDSFLGKSATHFKTRGNEYIHTGSSVFSTMEPKGRAGAKAIEDAIAPSDRRLDNISKLENIPSGNIRDIETYNTHIPNQSQTFVQNELSGKLSEGRFPPPHTQILPRRGESYASALQRTADYINNGDIDGLKSSIDTSILSHLVNKNVEIPSGVSINPEKGEPYNFAALKAAKLLNEGKHPYQNIPVNSAEFKERFPFQSISYVKDLLEPFVDKNKMDSIPNGLQLIRMPGESFKDMKIRYGNAINSGKSEEDRANNAYAEQDKSFLSHLAPGKRIPKGSRIIKTNNESFADAALRTAQNLGDKST